MNIENKVKELVNEQYAKMGLANARMDWDIKQVELNNRCQEIIYNEWDLGSQKLWDMVDGYVKKLIPDQYED